MKKTCILLIMALIIIFSTGCQQTTTSSTPGTPDASVNQDNAAGDDNLQETADLKEETIKLMNQKKFDEALIVINKAIEIDPRDDLLSKRADIYVSQGKLDEAEKDLQEALKVSERADRKALIYGQLVDIYGLQGETEKSVSAVKEFEKLDAELPEDSFKELPVVYGAMGSVLSDHGEYEKAIIYFDKALAKDPGRSRLIFERSYAWFEKGDKDKAKAGIEEWLKTNPPSEKGIDLSTMANAYKILGEYDKALEYINKAIEKNPNDFGFHNDRAYIYILKGDKKAAVKDLELVIEKYPDENTFERKLAKKLMDKAK